MQMRLRFELILIMAVLALATALRFYALDHSSLWSDEGNTWALVQRPWAQIARDAAADIHPPGYYWALKAWTALWGTSAWALRSFSAVAGVLLVAAIAAVAAQFRSARHRRALFPTLAALTAAVNPFQIYYSQEARMYMLLALEATVLLWATVVMARRGMAPQTAADAGHPRQPRVAQAAFVLAGAAGLWTHYSFPIVLAAVGLGFLWAWVQARRRAESLSLGVFVLLNVLVLLLFLPWLPTAVTSVLNWPKGGVDIGLATGVQRTFQTLLFGPLRTVPTPLWPWLTAAVLLPLVGAAALWRQRGSQAVMLTLLLPIGLMFGLGLFSAAFMKFLLVASPAWCLLVAAAPHIVSLERAPDDLAARADTRTVTGVLQAMVAVGALVAAALVLPAYYTAPDARDNYQGVAAYIVAVADPARDLVLLDAPGQREVWAYYDPGVPVVALPAARPPDAADTVAALDIATAGKRTVYALFWATDEADPAQIVEGWLDGHAFKGLESWQGNMRLAVYTMDGDLTCADPAAPARFGTDIAVTQLCTSAAAVTPGETLLVDLTWVADATPDRAYNVSVQLLDAANQVIAQHDGAPGGGAVPTNAWAPAAPVRDRHALVVPFGTPPGAYRLAVALYDPSTGARLPVSGPAVDAGLFDAGTVEVTRADAPAPVAIVPMQHRVGRPLGALTLLGYDVYRQGYAHAPQTPVPPGAPVQFVFYWQAPATADRLPADADLRLTLGEHRVELPVAPGFPTGAWAPGDLVRTLVTLPYDGGDPRAELEVGGDRLVLQAVPQ